MLNRLRLRWDTRKMPIGNRRTLMRSSLISSLMRFDILLYGLPFQSTIKNLAQRGLARRPSDPRRGWVDSFLNANCKNNLVWHLEEPTGWGIHTRAYRELLKPVFIDEKDLPLKDQTPRPGLEPGSKAPEASRMSTTLPRHVHFALVAKYHINNAMQANKTLVGNEER
jgi:hypothetical protein